MKQTYINAETLNIEEQEVVVGNNKENKDFKPKNEEENIQIHEDQLEFAYISQFIFKIQKKINRKTFQ